MNRDIKLENLYKDMQLDPETELTVYIAPDDVSNFNEISIKKGYVVVTPENPSWIKIIGIYNLNITSGNGFEKYIHYSPIATEGLIPLVLSNPKGIYDGYILWNSWGFESIIPYK